MNLFKRNQQNTDSDIVKSETNHLSKLKLIITLVQNGNYSIKEIMDELGVSKRKAKLYLQQISKDGYVLKKDKKTDTYWIEI